MSSKNPYAQYETLFEGWPSVHAWSVRGENGMRVAGWHNTPDRSKRADSLSFMAMIGWAALIGFCFYTAYPGIKHNNQWGPEFWAMVAVLAWIVLSFVTYCVLCRRASKATIVCLSPSFIQIGEKVYDARVQHKFSMDIHRKAKEEADEELRAQQRGPEYADTRHTKYYRNAYHIYLEYLGQRRLVTDISGEENAEKLLRALMAVDKVVHKEKTVFAVNSNMPNTEEFPGARSEREDYFGARPALD